MALRSKLSQLSDVNHEPFRHQDLKEDVTCNAHLISLVDEHRLEDEAYD